MKAVIFDMDGVLVDSEHQWALAQEPLLRRLLPSWGPEDHERVVGLGVDDLYRYLVERHGLKEPLERFLALYDEIARDVYLRRVTLADGLPKIFDDLKKHRVRTAVASSSPKRWIEMALNRFDLRRFFSCVASADDVGGRGKPEPDVYLYAAKRLGLAPAQCVAVEDSAHGIRAAKKAGMYCIALHNGTNAGQDMTAADEQIKNLSQLSYARLNRLLPIAPRKKQAVGRRGMPQQRGLFVLAAILLVQLAAGSAQAATRKRPNVFNPLAGAQAGEQPAASKRTGGIFKFGQDVTVGPDDIVSGPVIVVGGSAHLEAGSSVDGPVVSIGGHAVVDPGAEVGGPVLELPRSFVPWRILGLAVGPAAWMLGSYWLVYKIFNALGWLAVSLMLWILFPEALENSRRSLAEEPAMAALMGILFWPSAGIISVILLVSLVGIPLLPLAVLTAVASWFWGFTTLGLYLGDRLSRQGYWEKPVVSVLAGTALLRMLEWVPILGFLLYLTIAVLGVGVAIHSRFGSRRLGN